LRTVAERNAAAKRRVFIIISVWMVKAEAVRSAVPRSPV
jgi:hypothetical protein